jgi:hypothetical protein
MSSQERVLVERATHATARLPISATYEPAFNRISEKPGVAAELPIVLRNTGRMTWQARGDSAVTLAYHWYDTVAKQIVDVPAVQTQLPFDVAGDQSVTVHAQFKTPEVPGFYLISWDLKTGAEWFSSSNVSVSVVEADIRGDAESVRSTGDVSRWYRKPNDSGPIATADVPRERLWSAALRMAQERPLLGVGPDNFRLTYGPQLGFARWDDKIHSNSLYLELLAGSGCLGLMTFLLVPWQLSWRPSTAMIALAVSLVHGLVDFFLMTTPIYLGFWIVMGYAASELHESRV